MRGPRYFILLMFLALGPSKAGAKDVAVTPEQVRQLNIRLEPVKEVKTETVATLPGTVVPPLNTRVVAAAPFAGTVVQVHVLPGQRVSKGAPLITVSSRELLEAQSQLAQSEAELQTADAVARRRRALADKNYQNPTLADEAEAQVAKIRAVIEQHKRTAALNGIVTRDDGQYSVPAPTDGIAAETRVMPGDKIDAMTAAVTIDTSDELWIEVQVPKNIVSLIKRGDILEVENGPQGRVVSIGGSLDRMTRSAVMFATIPADSGLLPGQMVNVNILHTTETGGLVVPSSAIVTVENTSAVFVRSESGFNLVPVALRGRSPDLATISGPIGAKAQVAASGIPQLERLLQGE
ncbi:efflux RND transporter periplasmic adaptor subunit [Hyphomicrobium sp.]|uniref:efflux RND transporter periplasmic adaptor subunit n=1 Tax=Hyphomicrobium sp. TaxID=82 RepID=UPI001D38A694|nr:efflux RND transporter periplasmic adaptor subunit [Hyphomicrobium sp.]MBY0562489.1 efflux RND transporter periplasmic adaptor subunit [Hyphomicrobium sp.]